ncbi:hypothetical protein PAECIP111893_00437 [Paenibacillus plantiphilus]|uniref:Glycosyltransferase RgtA/B/C/D-like domain-containing protein n=1 Tax=Paenibacillus plantiphilus TaxID=2905650 RepID=A0ABN8FVX2_9BACL|nr:DUF6020 family protein [Paenibacillus plantiphilus]CAH1193337.1 hypothetical protein PAECIP111893_00437 [Paenibacillus plantiphilus]
MLNRTVWIYFFISLILTVFMNNTILVNIPLSRIGAYLTALFILFVFIGVVSKVGPKFICKMKTNSRKSLWLSLVFSCILALALIAAIPLSGPNSGYFQSSRDSQLTITVKGEANASAQGSEVWINELSVDGKRVGFENLAINYDSNSWKVIEGSLESAVKGAVFSWQGEVDESVNLKLGSHPWSGKAIVSFNGDTIEKDLYSESGTIQEVSFSLSELSAIEQGVNFIVNVISLSILLFVSITYLLSYKPVRSEGHTRRFSRFFIYSGTILIIYIVYLIIYYPANMSADSINQYMQIQTGQFTDWHPILHTLLLWGIYKINSSPALVSICQILLMSSILGGAIYQLRKLGVHKSITYILLLFYALNPVNGVMSVTLWKDIPFAVLSLLLVIFTVYIYKSDYEWLKSKVNISLFIVVLIGVGLFRHNGIVTVIGVIVLMFLFYKQYWKKSLLITLSVLLGIGFISGPLSRLLNVEPAPPHFKFGIQLHQVGTMIHHNVGLRSEEQSLFTSILPISSWKGEDTIYSPYSANYLLFHPKLNAEILAENKWDFIRYWLQLAGRNPTIFIQDWKNMTSLVWKIQQPTDGYTYTTNIGIIDNPYNLVQFNALPVLKEAINKIIRFTEKPSNNWLFWRPAMFLFAVLLFGFIFIRRNDRRALLIVAPVLFEAAGLMISTPAQDARYFYSVTLIAPFIIAISFYSIKKE